MAYYQIPQALLAGMCRNGAWAGSPPGFFIAFVFLVVGCFLDAIPAIIIVGTILQPIAAAAACDPIHFAMIGIISTGVRAGDAALWPVPDDLLHDRRHAAQARCTKDVMLMLLPMIGVLVLVIVWPPDAMLWLPRT